MRILVVTGASGGHIFPALGFLDTLKDVYKDIETLLVLPKNNLVNRKEEFDYQIKYISISPIKFNLDFKNLLAIFMLFLGSLESLVILLKFRPDTVVGFGSVACIPMVVFAWLLRIKTLIHEQNVIPGRANRLLAIFSDRIAVSFSKTRDYLKKYKQKVVLTGNPRRKELVQIEKNRALDFFGFSHDKFTILVMGGSQGSHKINVEFLRAISGIVDNFKLQVIHLGGTYDYDLLKASYRDLDIYSRFFNFFRPMQYAYSASDLVISRAGASTISEIIFFGIPAIIIPYPFAYKHQMANARVLESKGCAVIIKDSDLSADILRKNIENFVQNPQRLKVMRSYYTAFSQADTNVKFIETVLSLYRKLNK